MAQNEENIANQCRSCTFAERCHQVPEDCFTSRQRWKAVALAFALPFFIILGGVIGLNALRYSEMVIGISVLIFVAIYYFILWLCKPKV